MIKESGIVEKNANELLGGDAACFALLLHLTTAISGFNEGPFRAGFEMAIEEGGAYLDSEAGDGGTQAQTLMEQMIGLVSGVYALTEIKGPMGIVAEEKEETRWKERAFAAESSIHRVRREMIEEVSKYLDGIDPYSMIHFDAKAGVTSLVDEEDHMTVRVYTKTQLLKAISSLNIAGLDTGAVKTGAAG